LAPGDLDRLLDDLEKRGWLSEARFVEQLSTVRRRKYGASRILHELREKGVSAAGLGEARERLRKDELAAARAVWRRKFGVLPGTLAEKARQARFLAGRGFSAEAIRAVLKAGGDE
jgi:regulatory protein